MTQVAFTKMHGLGNDFVIVDGRDGDLAIGGTQARAIGDRRRGVGFDQLLILEPAKDAAADLFMRILNPDGSEAEACGNGTRCVAARVMDELGRDTLNIETVAGVLATTTGADGLVTVDMGPANLEWRQIPLAVEADTLHLDIENGPLRDPVAVNIGNPHMVFFVDDADAIDVAGLGPALESHPLYPERTNVEICSLSGPDQLRMRVWERGAGITQACGSGACAAGVAAARRGLTGRRVEIVLDGGPLSIEWREDGRVLMTGPVATSFEGTLGPELLAGGA
ncbi:MAG: diaminopimelate epimerase [Rhodospirillaceae bacterium]|jgi:diaminopimelate epimerase|nr:diaminopimelate epimerase [Rhodospirillaceae bacterium]MBT5516148.1 diaminopimelate epimerase [Rhodospirillaceae bacterium]MBT6883443.1 diaminopimelate epimerase [Rhodospirillaceae bacterium]MBT7512457.1 diaminopimelate epimerase [Rhodospirillaceae bacterium]